MVLKLSTTHPIVWLSPSSLQVGVDVPLAVLDRAPRRIEVLLGALERGVADGSPGAIAARFGLPRGEVERVLSWLAPALSPELPPLLGRSVRVEATDEPVLAALSEQVTALGAHLAGGPDDQGVLPWAEVDLAVLAFRFAVQPRRCRPFLARDVPVLPIVFGEATASIGPLLGGDRPCGWRVHLAAVDADPQWEVKSIQAATRPAPSMHARGVAAVAAQTATALLRWADGADLTGSRVVVDLSPHPGPVDHLRTEAVSVHPGCGCRALPGSERATGPPSAAHPDEPTTGGDGSWLG